ncbi:MAG: glucosaminidase domain-containing protein, partial [Gammaproteobacteria bacterium]
MNHLKSKLALLIFLLPIISNAGHYWSFDQWLNSLKAPEFDKIEDVQEMKKTFFNYLLPEINKKNNEIKLLRKRVIEKDLSIEELTKLYKKYLIDEGFGIVALLEKIDIIPPSLVLSQAALESNWGRSRFAKFYHNYFGLWCFERGCGVIPKKRDKGDTHEVAKFSSPEKAIDFYFLSINRNKSYEVLRKIRQDKRSKGQIISGLSMSEGLTNYAEIGYEYVLRIRKIIISNQLSKHD